jgi:peptide/nickel transport system permease protein
MIAGLSVILFLLLVAAPGDPVDLLLLGNPNATADDVARLREFYGLNDPIYIRYVKWMRAALHGDFGYSRTWKVPVTDLIGARIANSMWLVLPSFVVALVVAIPLGVYSALHQNSTVDYAATFFAFVGVSVPTFWTGIMVIYLFAVVLHVLPPGGFASPGVTEGAALIVDRFRHALLPVAVLSMFGMAGFTRFARASMLEVMSQDYVRTARAKGLGERRVISHHAFRNGLIPIVTLTALAIPGLFGGAPLTETVFGWPGIGRLIVESTIGGDFAVAQVALMILAFLTMFFNLLADVALAIVDPRIRYD